MTSIEDYLHLYLGCDLFAPAEEEGAKYGIFKLTPEKLASFLSGGMWAKTKPILRPLSDMTEEELKEVRRTMLEYSDLSFSPSAHQHMSKRGQTFYYENYDDEGNHISSSVSNISNLPLKCIPLLLSKGFDLFDLIEAGLAIDKTKL